MATKKTEVMEQANKNAELVVNNAFVDALVKQLEEKQEYGLTFPKDYNVNNAMMGAYLTLKETTDKNGKNILQSCSQVSIANSLMDMAVSGLSVQKKQGYFVAYAGQCQFMPSYFGRITVARRYGLKSINAEIIYEGDNFQYEIVDGVKVFKSHTQDFLNIDNDKIVGAYAVAVMNDGEKRMEIMNLSQIKQAWKQGYGYKENGGTHAKFTDQMAKKTVTNRLLKLITNTYGDGAAMDVMSAEEPSKTVKADKSVAYDIETEANTVDFKEAEAEAEEKEVERIPEESVEIVEETGDPNVEVEGEQMEMPEFMQ